jgi:hypothetical protein
MVRKKTKRRRVAATRLTDEALIARLEDKAPEVLRASIPEAAFEVVVEGLLNESPSARERPHFYCRKCGEYHLKKHPHYSTNKSDSPIHQRASKL